MGTAKMTNYGTNMQGLRKALRSLPKESKKELTKASKVIAGEVAAGAQSKAGGLEARVGGWKYLARTIRAGSSSIPQVKIGGSRRIPKHTGKVGDLLWGLEFGGRKRPTTMQFLPHLGREGYALWPAVRAHEERTAKQYSAALNDALGNI